MGSLGNSTSSVTSATKENSYGFEVENTNSPDLSFTDTTWEKMAELRGYGAFTDSQLRSLVDDKISDLVDQYGDLEGYNSDLTSLIERIYDGNITEDEYWAGYHVAADMLGIK